MKRFALFACDQYYPCGGWDDFKGSFDSVHDALTELATTSCDWWHIIDLTSGEKIEEGRK